jgi:hypothetical protein
VLEAYAEYVSFEQVAPGCRLGSIRENGE